MMLITRLRINRNKLNLLLDLLLALVFVVELEEHFTGLRNHELLGLFFGAALLIHIILHWNWIVSITRKLFSKVLHESRLNYALNLILFADMSAATITGILISRTLGLNLQQFGGGGSALRELHVITSELSLMIVGLHIGMHWKWIVAHSRRYLFNSDWFRGLVTRRSTAAIPASPVSLTVSPSQEV